MVEQPAKVMRIGGMIRQLLEEVKAAPLDEASRARLREIHKASIKELEDGLAPELVEELDRLSLPFTEESVPSEAELRIAQAQLVGWLEGLFHGIQTTLFAQQMAARAQLEQMRRALPSGMVPPGARPAVGGGEAEQAAFLRPLPVGACLRPRRGAPGGRPPGGRLRRGGPAARGPAACRSGTPRRPPGDGGAPRHRKGASPGRRATGRVGERRSRTSATPSSSLRGVLCVTAASTSGCAFATA